MSAVRDGAARGDAFVVTPVSPLTQLERTAAMLLRLSLVLVFLVFGAQKFTLVEAEGIAPLVSNSPLSSWLNAFGTLGASRVVGSCELTFGALLAFGLWRPGSLPAIVGAAGSSVTYLATLSFLLTTPGVFAPGQAPILSGDVGLFLLKDIVLLAASLVLLAQGLARRAADGRGPAAAR